MNFKSFLGLAVGAALTLSVSTALADGYYVGSVKDTAPIPAPVAYEWNGFSVGAGIGIGRIDQDVNATAMREEWLQKYECNKFGNNCEPKSGGHNKKHKDDEVGAGADSSDWNFFGTLQVGYDRLLNDRLLVGAFADLDFYRDSDLDFYNEEGPNWIKGKVERENMWTVGGRIGFLATPRILIYGLAAYSRMKLDGTMDAYFKDTYTNYGFTANPTNLSLRVDDNVSGWTAGGGLEAKLDKRVSLKFEYRYSHFGSASASVEQFDSDETPLSGCDKCNKTKWMRNIEEKGRVDLGDTDVHSVRAVLSFKLGRDEEQLAPLK